MLSPELKQKLHNDYYFDYAERLARDKKWLGGIFKAAKYTAIAGGVCAGVVLSGVALLPAGAYGALMVVNALSLFSLATASLTAVTALVCRNIVVNHALKKDIESGALPKRYANESLADTLTALDKKRDATLKSADSILTEMGKLKEAFAPFATSAKQAEPVAAAVETPAPQQKNTP